VTGARVVVSDVVKRFEGPDAPVVALARIGLTIEPGEAVAIVGESGSGKSTLLNLIGAMDAPSSGSVLLDGVELATLGSRERAGIRRRIGQVFQQFHLLPELGALENVAAPLVPYTSARSARRLARDCLEQVGLAPRERALPSQLSGGQQQRVAIARALVVDPVLILADEPTGNLDAFTARAVLDLLHQVRERLATTLVLVTHDPQVAGSCDRIVRLQAGSIAGDR
jgi:putative ABC transport system ATP-binding protein